MKLVARHFTYPYCFWGGADPSQKNFGKAEIIYVSAEEAHSLLKKEAVHNTGSGVMYEKA